MKLKEVCRATGLSRKTIRLYEEKGLLKPQKEYRNGREYRDYTDEDVGQLRIIASLRRAWFTMDEIRRMQEDPAAIQEIFPQYRAWLQAQKRQLDGLVAAAGRVTLEDIHSVAELSAQIQEETNKLPLPSADTQPHFKYLDEIEEVRRKELPEWREPLQDGIADDRVYRQFVAATSRATHDDLAVAFGQFNEARDAIKEGEGRDGPVWDREPEKDPLWLRCVKWVLDLAVLVWAVLSAILLDEEGIPRECWIPLLLVIAARVLAALGGYLWRKFRKRA